MTPTDTAMAYALRAHELHEEQRDLEAMRLVDAALGIDPDLTGTLLLKGLIALRHGDYATGLPLYEYRDHRINASTAGMNRYRDRQWMGAPSPDRLLLWGEQGYGDTIMMLRYVPYVRQLCPDVLLEVQPEVVPLCADLAPAVPAAAHRLTGYAHRCTLMSLPYLFRDTNLPIPPTPYLRFPKAGRRPPEGVGLCWASRSVNNAERVARNVPYRLLAPLEEEFDFISLQQEDLGFPDFYKTALLLQELELVVTVDTAVAHLAGALGVETWLMLAMDADWRWEQRKTTTRWYANHRLFSQPAPGDWKSVIEDVRAALRERRERRAA